MYILRVCFRYAITLFKFAGFTSYSAPTRQVLLFVSAG